MEIDQNHKKDKKHKKEKKQKHKHKHKSKDDAVTEDLCDVGNDAGDSYNDKHKKHKKPKKHKSHKHKFSEKFSDTENGVSTLVYNWLLTVISKRHDATIFVLFNLNVNINLSKLSKCCNYLLIFRSTFKHENARVGN